MHSELVLWPIYDISSSTSKAPLYRSVLAFDVTSAAVVGVRSTSTCTTAIL